MHSSNLSPIEFQQASEVLKQKQISLEPQSLRKANQDEAVKHQQGEDENDGDYLFQDNYSQQQFRCESDQPIKSEEKLKKNYVENMEMQKAPILRHSKRSKKSKEREQKQILQESKGTDRAKGKPKYKRQHNQGDNIIFNSKVKRLFKNICEPNSTITVNSLGHALQRYKIAYRDIIEIVDMMQVFSCENQEECQFRAEDEQMLKSDVQLRMSEQQFGKNYRSTYLAGIKSMKRKSVISSEED